jgi:hypothetical protein
LREELPAFGLEEDFLAAGVFFFEAVVFLEAIFLKAVFLEAVFVEPVFLEAVFFRAGVSAAAAIARAGRAGMATGRLGLGAFFGIFGDAATGRL